MRVIIDRFVGDQLVLRMNFGAKFLDVFLVVAPSSVLPKFHRFGLGDFHHGMIRQLEFLPAGGSRVEVAGIDDAAHIAAAHQRRTSRGWSNRYQRGCRFCIHDLGALVSVPALFSFVFFGHLAQCAKYERGVPHVLPQSGQTDGTSGG